MDKKLNVPLFIVVFIATLLACYLLVPMSPHAPDQAVGTTAKKTVGSLMIGADKIAAGCIAELKNNPRMNAVYAEEYCSCLADMTSMVAASAHAGSTVGKSLKETLEESEKQGLDPATKEQTLKCQGIMKKMMR